MDQLFEYLQLIIKSLDNYDLNKVELESIKRSPDKRINIILGSKRIKSFLNKLFFSFFPNISSLTNDDIFKISRELLNYHMYMRDEFIKLDFNQSIIDKLYRCLIQPPPIDDFKCLLVGCPDSLDLDVVVVISQEYPLTIEINQQLIRDQLKIYDRELDINIIHLANRKVIASSKGSIKTLQGIIFHTQHLHSESSICLCVDPPEQFRIEDRIKPTINYIITNLKYLLAPVEYSKIHQSKTDAYNGTEYDKIAFIKSNNIFDLIRLNIDNLFAVSSRFRDLIKGIYYKLSTIILIKYDKSNQVEYYTKRGVAKLLDMIPLFPNSEINSLYYLFRGTNGLRSPDDLIFKLITDEFITICDDYIEQLDLTWSTICIDTTLKIDHIDPTIQELFWISPVIPSEEFIEYFKSICMDHIIEKHFLIPSSTLLDIINFEELVAKSYLVAQRSVEWFELRKKYILIEKNFYDDFKFDDMWVKNLFHLIVGSIGEQYVMYRVDWSKLFNGYRFINVGMLFDNDTLIGISPDGLLLNDQTLDIIPLEIKCIRQSKKLFTESNLREIKMARIQLEKVKQILTKSIITKGLIVFLYIYEDVVRCEYSIISLI